MNQTYSVSVLDHYYQVIYYIRYLSFDLNDKLDHFLPGDLRNPSGWIVHYLHSPGDGALEKQPASPNSRHPQEGPG